MKLQKAVSRRNKGKSYEKWFVNIPSEQIKTLGWKVGDNIESTINNNELILKSKGTDIVKIKKQGNLTYYERFVRVYNNLPLDERKLPIVVINGEAFTWYRCNVEITGRTKLGKKIGEKLIRLDII
ncbi:MAG: hypothetical protein GX950_01935 [Candidatus Diapherotrites archaeon]|jgi:bifunctional DNA-binding transcriptional regulator/antitoxin component of YhaV-PrlF toxin-antitoxin module|uniref:Uncharacterized protein n=1 Tax=Candidatus Iainarchaeum sp. TaxID=3101447 RepID=A0A7K4BZP8_9ARCH|nr:hypothetical protein [Candidatus Diapherotrites archaeon]